MGKRNDKSLSMSKPTTSQLVSKMITYEVNPELKFIDQCDRCGKEFTFTGKDVKNRTMTCPYCKNTMAFFRSNYM